MRPYVFLPGANAANTAINLPSDAPEYEAITSARLLTVGDFANAASDAPDNLAVVTAAPAGNQIRLTGPRQVELGVATTQYSVLVLFGTPVGARVAA